MARGEQGTVGCLVIGKGCGLETEQQLTAASSDFVAYFSASPTVLVKQIFIAVFYLHFLLSDHDIFFSCFCNKCIFFFHEIYFVVHFDAAAWHEAFFII